MLSIENIKIKEEFRKPTDDLYILFGTLDKIIGTRIEHIADKFLVKQYGLSYEEAQIVVSTHKQLNNKN